MDNFFLNDHRCQCGKLLLRGIFLDGALEVKCRRCGEINKIGRLNLTGDDVHYLLIIDDKGTITNASDSAFRILSRGDNELIGGGWRRLILSCIKKSVKNFLGRNRSWTRTIIFNLILFIYLAKRKESP